MNKLIDSAGRSGHVPFHIPRIRMLLQSCRGRFLAVLQFALAALIGSPAAASTAALLASPVVLLQVSRVALLVVSPAALFLSPAAMAS